MLESQIPDSLLKSLNRRNTAGTPIDKKQRKDKKQVSSSTESASFASACARVMPAMLLSFVEHGRYGFRFLGRM